MKANIPFTIVVGQPGHVWTPSFIRVVSPSGEAKEWKIVPDLRTSHLENDIRADYDVRTVLWAIRTFRR